MDSRPRVLFLCTRNACRSQMAEAWLRASAGAQVSVASAGLEAGSVHPKATVVMHEVGLDLSSHTSEDVNLYLANPPDLLITVCDAVAERCPELPARVSRMHWSIPDPEGATGSDEDILAVFRGVRDQIGERVRLWVGDGMQPLALER